MPFANIAQPELIQVADNIRLKRAIKDEYHLALPWYQNPRVLYYSEGVTDKTYNLEVINRMYEALAGIGELYFIEIFEDTWKAIGDVTLSQANMPIVIGVDKYCGLGIGKKVISKLIERATEIKLERLVIPAIYKYNSYSRNLFLSMGFVKIAESSNEEFYELILR